MKKPGKYWAFYIFRAGFLSGRMNSFYRANIGTGTAIGTDFCVDFIDIAWRDSLYWTFINTGTTCGTIFINFISHG
jgi:hypothetical protein